MNAPRACPDCGSLLWGPGPCLDCARADADGVHRDMVSHDPPRYAVTLGGQLYTQEQWEAIRAWLATVQAPLRPIPPLPDWEDLPPSQRQMWDAPGWPGTIMNGAHLAALRAAGWLVEPPPDQPEIHDVPTPPPARTGPQYATWSTGADPADTTPGDQVTHYAVVHFSGDPADEHPDEELRGQSPTLTIIAAGPEPFCWQHAARWTAAHPLRMWETVEVLHRTAVPWS